MAEVGQLAGRWVLPVVESTQDKQVRMHVSVAVANTDDLAGETVGASLVAGGQTLTLLQATPAGQLIYLETIGTTAVAQFVFDNPDDLTPESVTVTVQDQSASWPLGSGDTGGDTGGGGLVA